MDTPDPVKKNNIIYFQFFIDFTLFLDKKGGDLAQLVRVCDSQSQDKGSNPLISTKI